MDSLPPYGVPAASMNSVMLADWADPCTLSTDLTCLTASSTRPDSYSLVFRENGLRRVMMSIRSALIGNFHQKTSKIQRGRCCLEQQRPWLF
jgi:hypothetical protein